MRDGVCSYEFTNNDPHSPPPVRVNGIIINDVDFPAAFNCPNGNCSMAPNKRCAIW